MTITSAHITAQPKAQFANEPSGPVKSAYVNPYKAEGVAPSAQRSEFWSAQEDDAKKAKLAAEEEAKKAKAALEAERIAREAAAEKTREAATEARLAAAKAAAPVTKAAEQPAPVKVLHNNAVPFLR